MRLSIGSRPVGDGAPCFIVAEAGQCHLGSAEMATLLVEQAAAAGADAIKFQTIKTEELYDRSAKRFEICKRQELSRATYEALMSKAQERGILLFSTPFDEWSADLLEEVGVPAFKIGSGELTHHAFLWHVARKGKPVILSTGMADFGAIGSALQVVRGTGNTQVILLHCVSLYPTPPEKANVRVIPNLRRTFDVLVGFSDHTTSASASLAAVALGACVIEKHFTLSRLLPGADHAISMEPGQLRSLVESIREVEAALGTGEKVVLPEERNLIALARRGVYARRAIARGEKIEEAMIVVRRPLSEIAASEKAKVIGCIAGTDIAEGEPLTWIKLLQSA